MPPKAADRTDLFPGVFEMMVLHVLQRQPLHGYALVQVIQSMSSDLLRVEEGSLSPALQRMLKAGLARSRWQTSQLGRRVKVYELTPAGAKHLQRQRSAFERMMASVRLVLTPAEP
jgi:transcriptional regulator